MKKYLFVLFAAIVVLSACNEVETSVSEESDGDDVTENLDSGKDKDEKTKDGKRVKIENQTFERYVDTSFSAEVVGVYAELKNTGNEPVTIHNVEVTLYDSDGDILAVENEGSSILVSPFYLGPEDSGYISLNVDYDSNFKDLDHAEIKFDEQELQDEEIRNLKVTKENILKDDGFFIHEDESEDFDSKISDAIKVMFNLENTHGSELSYVVGIGFYDSNDKFIGASVPVNYIDVDYAIDSGESKNVEVLEFLPVDYEDIEKVEINAIGVPLDNE